METKRLMRASHDKMIAGVCAGLANYFNLDPNIMRLGFVLAFALFGFGPLIYILCWIFLPVTANQ